MTAEEQVRAATERNLGPKKSRKLDDALQRLIEMLGPQENVITVVNAWHGMRDGVWAITSERILWSPKKADKEAVSLPAKDVTSVKGLKERLGTRVDVRTSGGERYSLLNLPNEQAEEVVKAVLVLMGEPIWRQNDGTFARVEGEVPKERLVTLSDPKPSGPSSDGGVSADSIFQASFAPRLHDGETVIALVTAMVVAYRPALRESQTDLRAGWLLVTNRGLRWHLAEDGLTADGPGAGEAAFQDLSPVQAYKREMEHGLRFTFLELNEKPSNSFWELRLIVIGIEDTSENNALIAHIVTSCPKDSNTSG